MLKLGLNCNDSLNDYVFNFSPKFPQKLPGHVQVFFVRRNFQTNRKKRDFGYHSSLALMGVLAPRIAAAPVVEDFEKVLKASKGTVP